MQETWQEKCRAPGPGQPFCTNPRSGNVHGHLGKTILCENLPGKWLRRRTDGAPWSNLGLYAYCKLQEPISVKALFLGRKLPGIKTMNEAHVNLWYCNPRPINYIVKCWHIMSAYCFFPLSVRIPKYNHKSTNQFRNAPYEFVNFCWTW